MLTSGWSAKPTVRYAFGRAIASICYESALPHAAAGGQFILSASNNAHYSPAMPAQHHAQDVMRQLKAIAGLYERILNYWIPTAEPSGYLDLTPTNCTRQRSTGNRRRLYTYVGIG